MAKGKMVKGKKVGKTRLVKCAYCKGTGVDPNTGGAFVDAKPCPTCKGVGKVWM